MHSHARKRTILYGGWLLLLIIIACALISRWHQKSPVFQLSDGSVLRFDGADVGTELYFPLSQRMRIRLWHMLPLKLRKHIESPGPSGVFQFPRDHLFAGFERKFGLDGSPGIGAIIRGSTSQVLLSDGTKSAQLFVIAVDDSGFEASIGSPGLTITRTSAYELISTSIWPRRSKRIGLRLHEIQGTNLQFIGEVWLSNPKRSKQPPQAQPEELPVTKTNQSIAATLKSLEHGRLPASLDQNDQREWTYCRLEVNENGVLSTNWQVTYCVLSDGSGNSLEYAAESVSIDGEEYLILRPELPDFSGIYMPRTLWIAGETTWKLDIALNERFNPKRDSATRVFGTGRTRHAWIHSSPIYDERWLTFQVRPPARQESN